MDKKNLVRAVRDFKMKNRRILTKKEMETYNKFHIPGCSNFMKRKVNAIHISPSNSWEHELAKCKECYIMQKAGQKYITECCRNKKDKEGIIRRVDIVCLSTGHEIEIIHKHESHQEVFQYRKEKIIPNIVKQIK